MCNMYEDKFTLKQTMTNPNFEFYHYRDTVPPKIELHQHPFYEIFFLISGDVEYVIEGKTYHLRPGDILLTNNKDIHKPNIAEGKVYERYVLWISDDFFNHINMCGEDLSSCFIDASGKDYRLIRPDNDSLIRLKYIAENIMRAKHSTEFGSYALTAAYIMEFLVKLSRCYFNVIDNSSTLNKIKNDVTENSLVNNTLLYINGNITSDLNLDDIAAKMYVSKFYLSRLFKQFTGLSIYQYIIKKRLTISRNLIKEGMPVTDAYINCGFNDYSNYHKAFKREFDKNPSDFAPKKIRAKI